mmetsp:Transcript_83099/g.178133  ORF Transcript_83099/g.178133 Transcript_83099/m.178133 type:complete len:981 (+) Transcript_83099:101-3043(+)
MRIHVLCGAVLVLGALRSGSGEEPACDVVDVQDQEVDEDVQLQLVSSAVFGKGGLKAAAAFDKALNATRTNISRHSGAGSTHDSTVKKLSSDEAELILELQGFFLGASRDFWIILSMCFVSFLFSLTVVWCVSLSLKARINEVAKDTGGNDRILKPIFRLSLLQRKLFFGEKNRAFAMTADCAFRGAIACTACVLPYYFSAFSWFTDQGWSMQYALVIITFTLFKSLGNTMQSAWYNFFGTVVPICNTLLLYSFFPVGTTGQGEFKSTWWIGAVNLICFVVLMIVLNVPLGVRMFALSWQAYWSMCFLDPADTTEFSLGFRKILLKGAAIGPLAGTVIGCVISILCMLSSPLGPCLCNLRSSLEIALDLAWHEGELWKEIIADFKGKTASFRVEAFVGQIDQLGANVAKLQDCLGSTWWECFGIGHPGRVKANLTELADTLARMQELLPERSLSVSAFGSKHEQLMDLVAPKMETLSHSASQLLSRAARVGASGGRQDVSQEEVDALTQGLATMATGQKDLAECIAKARLQVYGAAFFEDTINESCVILAFSTYCCYVAQYVEYLLADEQVKDPSPWQAFKARTKETFTCNTWDFSLRNCGAFLVAFVLGYTGIHGAGPKSGFWAVAPLDSTIAGTSAYLMAAEGKGGSALAKNVGRFLGTGGGTLLGAMAFHIGVDCTWHGTLVGVVMLLALQFFSFHLYFTSSQFGYVGLLLAAYGGQRLLMPCGTAEHSEAAILNIIANQFYAIIAVTVAEVLLPNAKASDLATSAYADANKAFVASWRAYLGISGDTVSLKDKNAVTMLEQARELGKEAFIEPRMVRTPWPDYFWGKVLEPMWSMGEALHLLTSRSIVSVASPVREALAASDEVKQKGEALALTAEESFAMAVKVLRHDTVQPFDIPEDVIARLLEDKRPLSDSMSSMKGVIKQRLAGRVKGRTAVENATEDVICQAAMTLRLLEKILDSFGRLEDAIVGLPEVKK